MPSLTPRRRPFTARRGCAALAVTLLAGAACRDGSPTAPPQCDGPVAVEVRLTAVSDLSSLVSPEFRWRPDCLAGGIVVSETANASRVAWRFTTRENEVPVPVRYGRVPSGVASDEGGVGPLLLVAGRAYTVQVLRKRPYACGPEGCGFEWGEEGRASFTAP